MRRRGMYGVPCSRSLQTFVEAEIIPEIPKMILWTMLCVEYFLSNMGKLQQLLLQAGTCHNFNNKVLLLLLVVVQKYRQTDYWASEHQACLLFFVRISHVTMPKFQLFRTAHFIIISPFHLSVTFFWVM